MPLGQVQPSKSRAWNWRLSTLVRDSKLHPFRNSSKSSKSTRTKRVKPCIIKVFLESSRRSVQHSYRDLPRQAQQSLKISGGVIVRITQCPIINMSAQPIKSFNHALNSSFPRFQLRKVQLACWQQETPNTIKWPPESTYLRSKIAQVSFLQVQRTRLRKINRQHKNRLRRVKWKILLSNRLEVAARLTFCSGAIHRLVRKPPRSVTRRPWVPTWASLSKCTPYLTLNASKQAA